jgi:clan AA aspartic protease (TIGR02281 family)
MGASGLDVAHLQVTTMMIRKAFVLCLLASFGMHAARAAALPESDFMMISIEKRSTGTYYVPGQIDGFGKVDLLVDTGSSYLVINENMLDELKGHGGAEYSRDLEGRMADGSTRVIPLYKLAGVRLGDGCWVHDVEAAVFPGAARPILGMNVLSRVAPFTFSADPARLSLANCQHDAPPAGVESARAAEGVAH